MPYLEPRQTKKGWVLPKKEGGYHKSSKGKIVYFKSKADLVLSQRKAKIFYSICFCF